MRRIWTTGWWSVILLIVGSGCGSLRLGLHAASPASFTPSTDALATAVAIEAEFFTIERDWKVIRNGEGNYMVDIIGFQHIGGERLLGVDERNSTAHAWHDVVIPEDGDYRLIVRYEYPPFTECRFEVQVTQGRSSVANMIMGRKDNPRFAFGESNARPQYDPPWGAEGLAEEALNVTGLKAGTARIHLRAVEQPQIPGVTARRHIDLVYLSRDMTDSWRTRHQGAYLYPILDAFRETVGPRWEVRALNRGEVPLTLNAAHTINRLPWYLSDPNLAVGVAPGEWSEWQGLRRHDTTHFHHTTFIGSQPFELEIRPTGGGEGGRRLTPDATGRVGVYLPPYPAWGESPILPEEQLEKILALLRERPAPGRSPTRTVSYGGWIGIGSATQAARLYAELYTAIGMRGILSNNPHPDRMREAGIEPTRSYALSGYRNYPVESNILALRQRVEEQGLAPYLRWFDYGDEIHFAEWVGLMLQHTEQDVGTLWRDWLGENRPGYAPADYWLDAWGALDAAALKPDSSAVAADQKPRLYVDSVKFYQESAIAFLAEGMQIIKRELGDHVLGGANYSAHPLYYPSTAMYVHWFRGGAADFGRHSEYFWQVTQAGPMINGYLVEHFRTGMRDIPHGVIRQYTMPHAPGNTDANFRRTAFTHLAHGARKLDYFGIGMNEGFTENHIDHRAHERYVSIRDVNYSMGLVEDLLPESVVVPSRAALLVSDSTERWDMAPMARDLAYVHQFNPEFRKLRLIYHLERLGLWKALTFAGESPDLLVEDDLTAEYLNPYRVLYVVGDSLPAGSAAVVRDWVERGGVLVGTATAGAVDSYRELVTDWAELFGIRDRTSELRDHFARPRQELPFLQPYDHIRIADTVVSDPGLDAMPSLAVVERFEPADDAEILAKFADAGDQPAVVRRTVGEGYVIYVGAFPGVAYLWQALQPPMVPDRGKHTHTVPMGFDPAADRLIRLGLETAGVTPRLAFDGRLIDARLIRSGDAHILPLADYDQETGQPLTLTIRIDTPVRRLSSAFHGELPFTLEAGVLTTTLPSVMYGDMLLLE